MTKLRGLCKTILTLSQYASKTVRLCLGAWTLVQSNLSDPFLRDLNTWRAYFHVSRMDFDSLLAVSHKNRKQDQRSKSSATIITSCARGLVGIPSERQGESHITLFTLPSFREQELKDPANQLQGCLGMRNALSLDLDPKKKNKSEATTVSSSAALSSLAISLTSHVEIFPWSMDQVRSRLKPFKHPEVVVLSGRRVE